VAFSPPVPTNGYPSKRAEVLATRKLMFWYEMLADFLIANPTATHDQMAKHFGRSSGTIALVVKTDAFKEYLLQRRNQYIQEHDAAIRMKMMGIAEGSMDAMLLQIEKKRDQVPLGQLKEITEMALTGLGMGPKAGGGTNVHVQVNQNPGMVAVPVNVNDLEAAREAMRRAQSRQIEHSEASAPVVPTIPPILSNEGED
jgi:hypothetical protein